MKINKKILARTILVLLSIAFFINVWFFAGAEWFYFLVGLISLACLISWSARHA